ncbi:MAG: phosphotransferase enzyme family protein, partial [Erythrobacter sp.]
MKNTVETEWLAAARTAIAGAGIELLAFETDAAAFHVSREIGGSSVFKAVRSSERKLSNLHSQWEVLSLFRDDPDFPGPRPLSRLSLGDGIEAIELSYVPGRHPQFESDGDFRILGETIARLHTLSRGKQLAGASAWDLARIVPHFEDPRLLRLMTERQRGIAQNALDQFGPRFQAQLDEGHWTGLVHSDCHRHNAVISDGRGSLIDFGECGFGPLFWDVGVAAADSATDAPERGDACRANLVDGYLSILPEASEPLRNELAVFEAMRSLEVMTWPVSDWSEERA